MRTFLGHLAVGCICLGLVAATFGVVMLVVSFTANTSEILGQAAITLGAGITTVLMSGAVLLLAEISEALAWSAERQTRHDRIAALEEGQLQ